MRMKECKTEFKKCFTSLCLRHQSHNVWEDFLECSAIALKNRFSFDNDLEQRYLQIVKKYNKEELDSICKLLSFTVLGLTEEPCDFLGELFGELELTNHYRGQFFTPYHLCTMMAQTIAEDLPQNREFTVNEPACGAGANLLALHNILPAERKEDAVYVAQDIDSRCFYMTYIQLSLIGARATVILGNTLANERRLIWYTPNFLLKPYNFQTQQPTKKKPFIRKNPR